MQRHGSDEVAAMDDYDDELENCMEILPRKVHEYVIVSAASAVTDSSLVKRHIMLRRGVGSRKN